jgi:hypothetical protein
VKFQLQMRLLKHLSTPPRMTRLSEPRRTFFRARKSHGPLRHPAQLMLMMRKFPLDQLGKVKYHLNVNNPGHCHQSLTCSVVCFQRFVPAVWAVAANCFAFPFQVLREFYRSWWSRNQERRKEKVELAYVYQTAYQRFRRETSKSCCLSPGCSFAHHSQSIATLKVGHSLLHS